MQLVPRLARVLELVLYVLGLGLVAARIENRVDALNRTAVRHEVPPDAHPLIGALLPQLPRRVSALGRALGAARVGDALESPLEERGKVRMLLRIAGHLAADRRAFERDGCARVVDDLRHMRGLSHAAFRQSY